MANNFVDINQSPDPLSGGSIKTTFNTLMLDDFDGTFRTLNVSGRGIITPSVSLTPKVGGDGAWLDSVRLPERIIKVEAQVSTDHATMKWLNNLLHTGVRELSFSDEPDLYYEAIFTGVSDYVDNKWRRIIVLTFTCLSPYKLGMMKTTSSHISSGYLHPVKPVKVTATVTKAGNQVVINADGSPSIVLVGAVSVGNVYVIQWQDPMVTLNGANASQRMSIASDYESVRWINGSVITSSQATLSIEYQERTL